jgi:hypothetical protein
LVIVPPLAAQDPFEIQVYEYATVPKGKWDLETHVNYTSHGTKAPEGTVAPGQGQLHLAFEFTRGLTDWFELAGYALFARRSGHSPDFVGYRIRPRVRAPDGWKLPVKLSLSLEAGFPRDLYEEADATLEVRPILERRFGPLQLDLNPVLGRSIKGPGSGGGWDFEPGARVGVTASPKVDLSVEYYGGWGRVGHFPPSDQQVHQIFGGGDYNFSESVVLNAGLGFAATPAGAQTVWKMRLGWIF